MIVNMIKNKKILFILLGIVFVFVFFFILFYKSDDDKLENYILGIGFKKSGNLYEKKLSGVTMKQYYSLVSENVPVSSSYLYFDLNRYLLTEVNSHYTYELQYNFLGSYDFKRLHKSKVVKYLSELSFCIFLGQIIYVWYAVKFAFEYVEFESNIMNILVSFIIVFCIANVMHYFVEIPSAKFLKQRLLANK